MIVSFTFFLPPSLYLWCAADAIDENYGVAVVFHEEDTEEGGKTDTVVAQEEDPMEVSNVHVHVCVSHLMCECS